MNARLSLVAPVFIRLSLLGACLGPGCQPAARNTASDHESVGSSIHIDERQREDDRFHAAEMARRNRLTDSARESASGRRSRLARRIGFRDWAPIWNHSDNSALREQRKNPMTLVPGDTVVIPEKQVLTATCETNKKHRFVVKALTAHFKFNLHDGEGAAIVGAPYELEVGGKTFEGETEEDGLIEHEVPHDAKTAKLTVEVDGKSVTWNLEVGGLQPLSTVDGVKARLNNLGYDVG
ncbi:MAG TPA: hypothetical protein PLV92_01270, partial [Pirellulaceae bacterium]|nr:hypothetical protein [Pirellulaceae bacterium]